MGLNIPCSVGAERIDREHVSWLENRNIWMLPGFSFRDLVAVQMKYDEGEERRSVVACSVYLPFDSEDLPQQGSLRNSRGIVKRKPSHSLWVATPIVIIQFGGARIAMIEEWPW
jgi:hypothetical protein